MFASSATYEVISCVLQYLYIVADDQAPPSDITSWFSSQGLGKTLPTALAHAHDIYALGMQVCE